MGVVPTCHLHASRTVSKRPKQSLIRRRIGLFYPCAQLLGFPTLNLQERGFNAPVALQCTA